MSLRDRLGSIRERMNRAADSVRRDVQEVELVAVSKTVSVETVKEVYDLGLRKFGESRLQEAIPKIEALPEDIEWHFIGKLQSNKAKRVAEQFQVIHSLESESQLKEILKANILEPVRALIELNLMGEEQKSGVSPENLPAFWNSVLQ